MKRLLTALLAVLFLGAAAHQNVDGDTSQPEPPASEPNRVAAILADGVPGLPDVPKPSAADLGYLDEAGLVELRASLTAYYRYRTTAFEHRRRVFDWQVVSSQVIFGVVILLVAIGLYFSWLQFMAASRTTTGATAKRENAPGPVPETDAQSGLRTTVEASLQGIKVSSPVLGVIILVISLAFFYLYLVHVYPITEVF